MGERGEKYLLGHIHILTHTHTHTHTHTRRVQGCRWFQFTTLRAVAAGEELTFDYDVWGVGGDMETTDFVTERETEFVTEGTNGRKRPRIGVKETYSRVNEANEVYEQMATERERGRERERETEGTSGGGGRGRRF